LVLGSKKLPRKLVLGWGVKQGNTRCVFKPQRKKETNPVGNKDKKKKKFWVLFPPGSSPLGPKKNRHLVVGRRVNKDDTQTTPNSQTSPRGRYVKMEKGWPPTYKCDAHCCCPRPKPPHPPKPPPKNPKGPPPGKKPTNN